MQVGGHHLKVALIAAIIIAGLVFGPGACARSPAAVAPLTFSGFIAALVAALWAYDGWNNVSMVASEIADPQRTCRVRLIGGTAGGNRDLFAGECGVFSRTDRRRKWRAARASPRK